jgi:hypothetical protein
MVELFLDEESVEVQIFLGLKTKQSNIVIVSTFNLTIILNSTLLTQLFVTIYI